MSKRVCIVCEGYEEYDYIMRLKECNVWSNEYIVKPQNAQSIDNAFAVYQHAYQSDNYDVVVIYCDTEEHPYKKFNLLCSKIDKFHDKKVAGNVVYFVNPCTLQVVLSHFSKVNLKSNQKSDNAAIVNKLTGVKDYLAKNKQREAIMKKVNADNYVTMKDHITKLSTEYIKVPSTNFLELINKLEANDTEWVDELKRMVDD